VTLAAVSDAGPLIHLAEIDALELLAAFDTLLIPETVYAEVETGGIPDGLSDRSYELVDAAARPVPSTELDAGERAALAVATDHDVTFLTDDLAAREAASEVGVDVHGSIGIIALGYHRGMLHREQAASLMHALQQETSLFVTRAIVERGIRQLDESHRTDD
jgi:predicted nucleic acid-binding protein